MSGDAPARNVVGSTLVTAAIVAAIAWIGIVAIGIQLASTSSATLGFDFQLLLQAGRDVAAGRSPYDPSLLAGGAPTATELFYSYPPPVAQAFALVGWLPNRVALVLGRRRRLGLVSADQLRRLLAPDRSRRVFLRSARPRRR